MELYEQRDGGYARDIEEVDAEPAERNEPRLMPPSARRGQQQAEPDERLLQRRATPHNAHRIARSKTDDMVVGHIRRVAEKRNHGIYHRRDMLRHYLKRRGDVPMPPQQDQGISLIARNRPFPCIVGDEQCYHEDKYVLIFAFWHRALSRWGRNRRLNT